MDRTAGQEPRIVFDVIPLILEASPHWSLRDLTSLARVSSIWLGPIRKLLYTTPTLGDFSSCVLFLRTLNNSPELASFLKGMILCPVIEDNRTICAAALSALRSVLSLEGLRTLTFGGELSVRAERFLHMLAFPEVAEDLRIDGYLLRHHSTRHPSLEWDESIGFAFPSLKRFSLSHVELEIPYPGLPYSLSLTYIELDQVQVISGYLPHLLQDCPSLKHVRVATSNPAEHREQLRLILSCYMIERLEFVVEIEEDSSQWAHGDWRSIPFDDACGCDSLLSLLMYGVALDAEMLDGIARLFPKVEELLISGSKVGIRAEEWLQFLQSRSLLKVLGLPPGTCAPPVSPWCPTSTETLQAACSQRNIALTFTN
jgi:hypothetical protein